MCYFFFMAFYEVYFFDSIVFIRDYVVLVEGATRKEHI